MEGVILEPQGNNFCNMAPMHNGFHCNSLMRSLYIILKLKMATTH